MLANPWIAALVALFLWWFSTGAILWVVKRADQEGPEALRAAAFAALPLLPLGAWAWASSLSGDNAASPYLGFLGTLAIWGWVELAFLAGIITGPSPYPAPATTGGWERFLRAWGTIAYHELLLIGIFTAMLLAADGAADLTGLFAFAVLFGARISAKLNLFFGVARFHSEFLPTPLAHLPSHFGRANLNALFPVSVTALTALTALWVQLYFSTSSTGFALLAMLTALALVEHWLMVLPLPDQKLWRWLIPAPKSTTKPVLRGERHGL